MIELGKYNDLYVLRSTSVGLYLGDDDGNDVLLPNRYVSYDYRVGDRITVFIYQDSEHRIIATNLTPKLLVNQFGVLRVKSVTNDGAFVDWGLAKDIFVPYSEQLNKMQVGENHLVYLYIDNITGRFVASARINQFVEYDSINLKSWEEVDLLVGYETEIGFEVIINNIHKGLIYKNEIFRRVKFGETTKGYVKLIREDGKVDIILEKPGYGKVEPSEQIILDILSYNNGKLELTDKSEPALIISELKMSKKTFKKAIGSLYRKRLVLLKPNGIYLVENYKS